MDKNAVKKFAVNARRKLIDSVSQKAYGLGTSKDKIKEVEEIPNGSRIKINNDYVYLTDTETEHRERLIDQIEYKGYEQVIEEVAYTWFNRIIAIRFMEVNDYLPTRVRVLSSEDENKVEPDSVTQALELIEDLGLDREKIYNYQDNNDTEGLFKYIFIKQCNALGKIMPVMFEKIQDYTELLLPDNLLVEGSVIRDLINDIKEDDFRNQVGIIGCLYQYYISEKKDEVFADLKKNKKITKENIPAATQLFTPDWIVKYMVENSLGRLWLEGHPNEELKSGWEYYLEEAEQEPDVEKDLEKIREESKKLSPEDITVLDPAMGSGHILVYAFDVLYQIYLSAGYSEREIPRLILEKNLYGLDIDDRAGQLAYFALIMKARSYSRRFFRDIEKNPIELNVCAIQESNGISEEDIEYLADGDEELKRDVEYLVNVFTDAKEYGSILKVEKTDLDRIKNRIIALNDSDKIKNLLNIKKINCLLEKLSIILKQYKVLNQEYNICVTNPPYMGRRNMNNNIKNYIDCNYKRSKNDLSTVFMEKMIKFTKSNNYCSLINMHSWMFLLYFEKIREYIIKNNNIESMIHLGAKSFQEISGEVVQSTSFVVRKKYINNYLTEFIDLRTGSSSKEKEILYLKNYDDNIYLCTSKDLFQIPGFPVAYWVNPKIRNLFSNKLFSEEMITVGQNLTGNNDKYLRYLWEVDNKEIGRNKKWLLYTKGGGSRKWYGNFSHIIRWDERAIHHYKEDKVCRIINENYWYKKGISLNLMSTDMPGFRGLREDVTHDIASSSFYVNDEIYNYSLGLLNSNISKEVLKILNPTLSYQLGDVGKIPYIYNENHKSMKICSIVDKSIKISKKDWDSFDTSWDFKQHPIIEFKSNNIENSFGNWLDFAEEQFNQLKLNEEELNRIFIDIYGLQDELTPEVEDKDVTIRKADRDREMKSFISYAVGCMMGRYSLDEEGLVFASGEFDINRYKTFKADKDAIIPITDMEYFEDDIVSRFVEFVKVVFGEETLEENLNYIADTECFKRKSNETSRECLRRYFLKGFMEDHLKVYQKRPIYWMFDSGKQNGFKALIYMHRYDENMVAKVRADYLHVLQRKYESEINRLDNDINSDILSTKEKTAAKKRKEKIQKQLAECKQYDQVIAHVAHQRIAIDLDDGVKVNYQKFQGIEVPQGDGKKDLKQDLLFKVKM